MHVSLYALLLRFLSNRGCVLRVAQPLLDAWQGDTVLSGGIRRSSTAPTRRSGNVPNEGSYGGGSALDAAISMQRRSSPASSARSHSRKGSARRGRKCPLALRFGMPYDEHHMRRTTTRSKEATHDRIVEAAARAIRRSGYNGMGVADIMKDAGLTHGGFYAHFPSREAMLAEAADRAGSESVATMERIAASAPPQQALQALLHAYLSKE